MTCGHNNMCIVCISKLLIDAAISNEEAKCPNCRNILVPNIKNLDEYQDPDERFRIQLYKFQDNNLIPRNIATEPWKKYAEAYDSIFKRNPTSESPQTTIRTNVTHQSPLTLLMSEGIGRALLNGTILTQAL